MRARDKTYFVYLLSSFKGTLYIGVTSDLERRVCEHRLGIRSTFASKYKANRLVHFEETSDVHEALAREKQLKGWTRAKKVALISASKPDWLDLSASWQDSSSLRSSE